MAEVDSKIKQVRKRDGRIVKFDSNKVEQAISKASHASGGGENVQAAELEKKVVGILESSEKNAIPNVEEVQDIVEKVLIEAGHVKTAKAYILYRQKRKEIREAKELIGVKDDIKLTVNAIKVLERRYLRKDVNGKVIETPGEMFRRVADFVAKADLLYGKDRQEAKKIADDFYEMMAALEFIPNSPTLMNAGTDNPQLSACYVLPIEDNLDSIFDTLKQAALLHQTAAGTGFSFSRLRPKGDFVKSSGGSASGPVSFLKIYNSATEAIKAGGRRRGANMGILRVDHPDIVEFVISKEKDESLENFNLSVALTDKFMRAVEADKFYNLLNPKTGEAVNRLSARKVFNLIATMAWKSGDPGVVFIDKMNDWRTNPTPHLGMIESTNPCGESPLLPYESCNLGSINLSKMVKEADSKREVDYEKLKDRVWKAVRFLDNVIDMTKYPLKKIEETTRFGNRKIGLGVMGFADMLIYLGLPYDTEEAIKVAGDAMKFISEQSKEASASLAKERGPFANWKHSTLKKKGYKPQRNAVTTVVAPTGTISIIAGCSSGIEPLYAVSFVRHIMDQTNLLEVNPLFEKIAIQKGFYSDTLMRAVASNGSIQDIEQIPQDVRRLFRTSMDISPEYHVRVQAAFQKHVDMGVSKTVNFPSTATTEDVEKVYMLAYKSGCKGITIYRDRSKSEQVLITEMAPKKKKTILIDKETGSCKVC